MSDAEAVGGFPAQVAERIEHSIKEGQHPPGSRLPSQRDLCGLHGVSLKTVRRALDILEARGLLYRRDRSGTFVHPAAFQPVGVDQPPSVRCINVIEPEQPASRAVLRRDYFAGYDETLQGSDVAVRTCRWDETAESPDLPLADDVPLDEQACILLNITPPDLMAQLGEIGVPYIVQHHRYYVTDSLPPHHRVYVNKVRAGFEATQHLLDLGHERVGFVGRLPEDMNFPGLYEGYRAALLCAGRDHGPNDILSFFTDEVDRAMGPMRAYLTRADRPGAIFTQTDALAFAVLENARELGIRVPEELSVVGFNDVPAAAETDPPLTTMSSPRRALARTAVEMLVSIADTRPKTFMSRVLNCHLVIRKSTAACPSDVPEDAGQGGAYSSGG